MDPAAATGQVRVAIVGDGALWIWRCRPLYRSGS